MGRTSEVHKLSTEGFGKARGIEPSAAPFPATYDRINDRYVDHREDDESMQLNSLGYSTGNDGSCRGGKHSLKQKVSPVRIVSVVVEYRCICRSLGMGRRMAQCREL